MKRVSIWAPVIVKGFYVVVAIRGPLGLGDFIQDVTC